MEGGTREELPGSRLHQAGGESREYPWAGASVGVRYNPHTSQRPAGILLVYLNVTWSQGKARRGMNDSRDQPYDTGAPGHLAGARSLVYGDVEASGKYKVFKIDNTLS